MKLYQIVASVGVIKDGWRSTVHLPTFYLREDMQMITTVSFAESIVRDMLRGLVPDAVSIDVNGSVGTIEIVNTEG